VVVNGREVYVADVKLLNKRLKRGLMVSDEEPLGVHKFSEWIAEHGSEFGKVYQNDLKERKYRSLSDD